VNNNIRNLIKLPKEVEFKIVNRKRDVITSVTVTIPIEYYVLCLKKRYRTLKPLNVLLFGQVGMGKSSFINTIATVFNENSKFNHRVLIPTITGSTTGTLTTAYRSFQFGNIRIFDTWGWEKSEQNANTSYSIEFFKCMLQGLVPENFDLSNVPNWGMHEIEESNPEKNKIDVAIFLVTPSNCSEDYLNIARQFHGVCGNLDVKSMWLLTQIDLYDKEMEVDPYYNNGEKLKLLLDQVCSDYSIVKVNLKPIVNYVNVEERTWELDKACLIPISHCFMLAENIDRGEE